MKPLYTATLFENKIFGEFRHDNDIQTNMIICTIIHVFVTYKTKRTEISVERIII